MIKLLCINDQYHGEIYFKTINAIYHNIKNKEISRSQTPPRIDQSVRHSNAEPF